MKVILLRDVPKVGKHGDIANVADGYARNYLFPRKFAVAAFGGALKEHQARISREKEKGERQLEHAQTDSEKLEGLSLLLIGKVGSGTKLYGSITAQDVADAIKKERGIAIDKRRVGLLDPIKTLGTYTIPVRLHSDLTIPVTVEVLTEEELERRKREPAPAPPKTVAAAESESAECELAEPEAEESAAESAESETQAPVEPDSGPESAEVDSAPEPQPSTDD